MSQAITHTLAQTAPKPWSDHKINEPISQNVSYVSIADGEVKKYQLKNRRKN